MKCAQPGCGRALEKCACWRGCSKCASGYRCPRHGRDWTYKTGGGFFSSGSSGSGRKCRSAAGLLLTASLAGEFQEKFVECAAARGKCAQ